MSSEFLIANGRAQWTQHETQDLEDGSIPVVDTYADPERREIPPRGFLRMVLLSVMEPYFHQHPYWEPW